MHINCRTQVNFFKNFHIVVSYPYLTCSCFLGKRREIDKRSLIKSRY